MRFGSNIQATQQQPGTVLQKLRQNIAGPQARHVSSLPVVQVGVRCNMYIPWGKQLVVQVLDLSGTEVGFKDLYLRVKS